MFDTFAYIENYRFDKRRKKVLEAIRESGIHRIVSMPDGLFSGISTREELKEYPWIRFATGLMPEFVRMINTERLEEEVRREMEKQIRSSATCAIVTGLDCTRLTEKWIEYEEQQKKWCRWLLGLAKKYKKPLVLVCKESYDEMLELLEEANEKENGAFRGIVANYLGDAETGSDFISKGFRLGIGPEIFQNRTVQETVRRTSLQHLVVGSGGPCERPRVWGGLNAPMILPMICKKIAALKDVSTKITRWWTENNAEELFGPVRNIVLQKQREMEELARAMVQLSFEEVKPKPSLLQIYPGLKWYWDLDEGETFMEVYQNLVLQKERIAQKWLMTESEETPVLIAMEAEYLRIRLVEDWMDERGYRTEEEDEELEEYMSRSLGGPVFLTKEEYARLKELTLNRKPMDIENESYMEIFLQDAFEMQGMIEVEDMEKNGNAE